MSHSSRLVGFYKLDPAARQELLAERFGLTAADLAVLESGGLTVELADRLIENSVGIYGLPLGIAANFKINDTDYLVPMAIEEPSVVAACSHAAKIVRESGGFQASADEPILTGQLQVLLDSAEELAGAESRVRAATPELLVLANEPHPGLVRRGGGALDIKAREFPATPAGPMLVVHLALDTRDAMGANLINTSLEKMAPRVAELTGGKVNLKIVTNLSDRRLARASCRVSDSAIGGAEVARRMVAAQVLAEIDPYRAATHNKGIMNGIDAVALATGNDWRAVEAGAHAYAAREGAYRALTNWQLAADGSLAGSIELPLAVGIVGGMTGAHPVARLALKILGVRSSQELAAVMAAVGVAQNLAALRALADEGIQQGHMQLQARRKKMEGTNG